MGIEYQINPDCGYNANLTIKSEEDLLVTDKITGKKTYAPCTDEDVNLFIIETKRLCETIQHTINALKWCVDKHANVSRYFYIYQNITDLTADYLRLIHMLHKKIYISIYGGKYEDKIMTVFTEELEKVLNVFLSLAINKQQEEFFQNLENTDLPYFIQEIHADCRIPETAKNYLNYKEFESFYKKFIATGLKLTMALTLKNIQSIEADIQSLYRTRIFRSDHETLIIYLYIKKVYDESKLKEHLVHFSNKIKEHFRVRVMSPNIEELRKKLDETEQSYNNYNICKTWREYGGIEEEEMEKLAYELSRLQSSPNEFERLFQYQGEYNWLSEKISERSDIELQGDSFFAEWVDPNKLEEYLKFWIKAEIKTQEKWYIVWCIMKYTSHLIKEGQTKNNFVNRMNLMFPDCEKKCKIDSIRKLETKRNHNQYFSEWFPSDKDYSIAESLYKKLKDKGKYKKDFRL